MQSQETFEGAMSHHMSRFEYDSLYVAMNELSNHDHSRFLTEPMDRLEEFRAKGQRQLKKAS